MSLLPRLMLLTAIPALIWGQTQIGLQQSKYLAPGRNAVSRTGASKLSDVVSIKDYGGVGDGVTDNLAAINRAFTAVSGTGQRILFPAGTYGVSGTVIIPNKTVIVGVGRGDAGSANTVIKALSTFPTGGVLMQMGSAPGPNFGVRVENLTIDGSSIAGTCLSNQYSEELSAGRDLLITACGSIGLQVATGAAQNSGPFENLEIYPGSGSTVNANSVCIQVRNVVAFRGIRGVTCNAGSNYSVRPNVAIDIDGAGTYSDFHVEHFKTAVSLGSSVTSADSMVFADAQFGPDVDVGLAITGNGVANQNLTVLGLSCNGCISLLTDAIMSKTIASPTLGWYMIGDGGGGGKTMLSSSGSIGGQVVGPFHGRGNASFGPSNPNSSNTLNIWDATPTTGATSVVEIAGSGQSTTNLYEWRNSANQAMAAVNQNGEFSSGAFKSFSGTAGLGNSSISLSNGTPLQWSSDATYYGTPDVGLSRSTAGNLSVTNGSSGLGTLKVSSLQMSSTGSQPACSSSLRGTFWLIQSATGTADHLQVCTKSAADTYNWVSVF